ncbi:ATP-binding cassette domain-containing protein [Lactiplantibacillus daowaiensis]|uniref:ATP-binding cassette domain-containing protein n=1 Tax=Lactiplantibacillus daowaiensis TaxID=2559918 RepID=A0ABW1S1L5_9LACO|nr:ABC transporter ATP-binding protein [Lactiplantibacillus daowaiensis]
MPTITLKHLRKNYLNQQILNLPALILPNHQITAITGPTGAGKSTLLNLIAGYQTPDAGQIYFDQQLVFNSQHQFSLQPTERRVAMLCHDFAFWPHMTVRENIAFPLWNQLPPLVVKQRVNRYLNLLDLQDHQNSYPGELSPIQKQHLALARVLATQPAVLIFNEVLSLGNLALAQHLRQTLTTLARQLAVTTIIVTTSDQVAMQVADYAVQLRQGHLQQAGIAKKLVITAN